MEKKLPDSGFRVCFESKVERTIKKYRLFTKKDRIAVAVSGGKDSTTCLYVLKQLGYNVEAITIDAQIGNYTKKNIENLKKFCKENEIKLHVVSFRKEFGRSLCYIRDVVNSKGHNFSSCMICGILKRYLLNKYSKKLKFDCLATGHNMDDEAQAFVMNLFRKNIAMAMRQGPVSGIKESERFVKRVKPLYLISEKDVIMYSKLMKFPVNYGICPCSVDAYRRKYRVILDELEQRNYKIKENLIKFHERYVMPLRARAARADIGSCSICGEATAGRICRTCQIFEALEKNGRKNE